MSPSHTRIFCLILSLFIHWQLFSLSWQPGAVGGAGGREALDECRPPGPGSNRTLALQQLLDPLEQGDGASGQERKRTILGRYIRAIKKEINLNKYSGLGPDKAAVIGNARYLFSIDGTGGFRSVRLVQSSGNPQLDRAARNAVTIAAHKVKRPPSLGDAPLDLTVTVKYQYGL